MNRTIITVVGKDTVGIIAKVCTYLAENGINILDISQTIVQGYFNMMMIVDTTLCTGHLPYCSPCAPTQRQAREDYSPCSDVPEALPSAYRAESGIKACRNFHSRDALFPRGFSASDSTDKGRPAAY